VKILLKAHKTHPLSKICENDCFLRSQKSNHRNDDCRKIHQIGIVFWFHLKPPIVV
jgi:hypothetical protein